MRTHAIALGLLVAAGGALSITVPQVSIAQTAAQPDAYVVPPVKRVTPKTPPLPKGVTPGKSKKSAKPAKKAAKSATAATSQPGKGASRCARGSIYDAATKSCTKPAATPAAKPQGAPAPNPAPK